ncbi:flagellar brake protein [Pontibacillus salicampi]|uniref:Flagellar brake protein n=1 Tax=Pontibacillus salicampi TaxID=1449801 RepID=A0ABV6LLB2_9BACI
MLHIGATITLELKHGKEEDVPVDIYRSKIVERDDSALYIDYPVNKNTNRVGFFMEGTQFKVTYIAQDQSVYEFETEIRGRKKLTIPVLVLPLPVKDEVLRVQRRKYVRVETAVDISIHSKDQQFLPFTGTTADISGGGAAIIPPINHGLKDNQIVETWLVLPIMSGDTEYIKTDAKVIRVWKEKERDTDKISVEFKAMEERDRQSIIRYCFQQQLLLRQRGVL